MPSTDGLCHQALHSPAWSKASAGAVLWLRNDIRLQDQPLLDAGHPSKGVWFYTFDKRFLAQRVELPGGLGHLRKASAKRALFLLQSVRALEKRLRVELGADLVVSNAAPEKAIVSLVQEVGWSEWEVHCQRELGTEEEMVQNRVGSAATSSGGSLVSRWGSQFLFHPDDVRSATGKDPAAVLVNPHHFWDGDAVANHHVPVRAVFPSVAGSTRRFVSDLDERVRDPLGLLTMAEDEALICLGYSVEEAQFACTPDPRAVLSFQGGEAAALARLDEWTENSLKDYYEQRSGLLGSEYSSKLSPWLAAGCISPLTVYHKVVKAGDDDSTRWFVSELAWRDLFRYHLLFHGRRVFLPAGPARAKRAWAQDLHLFQAWCQGKTGIPYIDAHMRELSATGFMSNTGRQLVASFLACCLRLDWRLGAMWFEATLLDHDVALNYGNWNREAHVRWARVGRESPDEQQIYMEGREQLIARLKGALQGGTGAYDTAKFICQWVTEVQAAAELSDENVLTVAVAHGYSKTCVFAVLCENCADLDRASRVQNGKLLCSLCRGACSWCGEIIAIHAAEEVAKRRRRLYCTNCQEQWKAN